MYLINIINLIINLIISNVIIIVKKITINLFKKYK